LGKIINEWKWFVISIEGLGSIKVFDDIKRSTTSGSAFVMVLGSLQLLKLIL
jgi:hypothetical protein